jgi:hypothetical protein
MSSMNVSTAQYAPGRSAIRHQWAPLKGCGGTVAGLVNDDGAGPFTFVAAAVLTRRSVSTPPDTAKWSDVAWTGRVSSVGFAATGVARGYAIVPEFCETVSRRLSRPTAPRAVPTLVPRSRAS